MYQLFIEIRLFMEINEVDLDPAHNSGDFSDGALVLIRGSEALGTTLKFD
jgi:hypothetical protein